MTANDKRRTTNLMTMARMRTFIAVPLSKPIRERVVALQAELAGTGADVKWVEPENLHFTLVFLGEVADKEVPKVCEIAAESVAGMASFRANVESLGCFPNSRRPRVIWIGINQGSEELCRIHDALEEPLTDLGYRREERRFTPHLTLGRVRNADRPTDKLSAAIQKHAGWKGGEMTVTEVHVMESKLSPYGPVYTVLGRAKLA